MLEIAIRHRFGSFTLDVAFTGPSDGVTALFGASGAGKSSILAAIAGSVRPAGATIRLDGRDLAGLPPERRRIGHVHQDALLFPHLSVERNLRYGLRRARGRDRIAFEAVIDVLAIGHLLARRPGALSGGERQRVALGRALLSQPDLLLMDEPLAALDAARKAEILPFLDQLKARFRLPIVYVTHAAAEARRLADHVVLIAVGRVVAEGAPDLLPAGWDASVVAVDPSTGEVRLRLAGALPAPGALVHISSI
jgi:molybdate transport system ATP-binding protein